MNVVRKEDAYKETYTVDDIYALPEGERAELIDGQIYFMATPSMIHQRLVMELSYRIRDYIGRKKGDCEVFPSPFAVFLNAEKDIYLEPDISVICDKDKITPEGCKDRQTGLLKLRHPQAVQWIIIRSCLNIVRQELGNIGLWILKRIGSRYMVSNEIH